jgi:hypothetical protein
LYTFFRVPAIEVLRDDGISQANGRDTQQQHEAHMGHTRQQQQAIANPHPFNQPSTVVGFH